MGDKGLLVKVDGNAQNIIEQWKKRSGIKQDSDGMDVLSTQVRFKGKNSGLNLEGQKYRYRERNCGINSFDFQPSKM